MKNIKQLAKRFKKEREGRRLKHAKEQIERERAFEESYERMEE